MARSGDLVDALTAPGETIRALEALSAWYEAQGMPGTREASDADRRAVNEGRFEGALWVGPKDEAAGLVRWRARGARCRGASVFLMPGYRNLGAVAALVERVDTVPGPTVDHLRVEGTELPPEEVARVMEPRGFRRLERFDMRFPADRPVPEAGPTPEGLRHPTADDTDRLGELLHDAYSDFPLDPILSGDEPDLAGSIAAVRSLFDGTYGRSWGSVSFVVERDGRLAAAVLVNDFMGPLIAEVMVGRSFRGHGLARALLAQSVGALRREGAPVPRLVVTAVNGRARKLYSSFGFELVPLPPDSTWLNPTRRGAPEVTELLPRYRAMSERS